MSNIKDLESDLKRLPVKYIRDYIKKKYKPREDCFICGRTDTIELHHLYSLSELFTTWCKKNNVADITQVDQIKELRVQFEIDCELELANENLLSLCKMHHERLHTIYGATYPNGMVVKIKRWVQIQREKILGPQGSIDSGLD